MVSLSRLLYLLATLALGGALLAYVWWLVLRYPHATAAVRILCWLPLSGLAILLAVLARRAKQPIRLPGPPRKTSAGVQRLFLYDNWLLAFLHLLLLGAAPLPLLEITAWWHTSDFALVNLVLWPFCGWCLWWMLRPYRLTWNRHNLSVGRMGLRRHVPWSAVESVRVWTDSHGRVPAVRIHVGEGSWPCLELVSPTQAEPLGRLLDAAAQHDKLQVIHPLIDTGISRRHGAWGPPWWLPGRLQPIDGLTGLLFLLLLPSCACAAALLLRAHYDPAWLSSLLSLGDTYSGDEMRPIYLMGVVVALLLWLLARTLMLPRQAGQGVGDGLPVLWCDAAGRWRRWRGGELTLKEDEIVLRHGEQALRIPRGEIEWVREEIVRNIWRFLPSLGLRPFCIAWQMDAKRARMGLVAGGASLRCMARNTEQLQLYLRGAAVPLPTAKVARYRAAAVLPAVAVALFSLVLLGWFVRDVDHGVYWQDHPAPPYVHLFHVHQGLDPLPGEGCWLHVHLDRTAQSGLRLIWVGYDGDVTWGPWASRAYYYDETMVLYRRGPSPLRSLFPFLDILPQRRIEPLYAFDRVRRRSWRVARRAPGHVFWVDHAQARVLLARRHGWHDPPHIERGDATAYTFHWLWLRDGKLTPWPREVMTPGSHMVVDLNRELLFVMRTGELAVTDLEGREQWRIVQPDNHYRLNLAFRGDETYMSNGYALARHRRPYDVAEVIWQATGHVDLVGGLAHDALSMLVTSHRGQGMDVVVANLGGAASRTVALAPDVQARARYSHDQAHALVLGQSLHWVDMESGEVRRLFP